VEHPEVVPEYLAKECADRRVLGLLPYRRSLESRSAGSG